MKKLWVGAFALVLSTAVYAGVAATIVDTSKFDTLAMIYKLSSPHDLIAGAAKPAAQGVLTDYVQLHRTRLEKPQQ